VVTDLAASRGVAWQSEAAVLLLGQVTATQPRRVTIASRRLTPVMLSTIIESAVPGIYIAVAVFRRGLARSVPVELTLIYVTARLPLPSGYPSSDRCLALQLAASFVVQLH